MSEERVDYLQSRFDIPILAGVAVASFLCTMIAFLPSLGSTYLLDEQFVAAWSKAIFQGTTINGFGSLLLWQGPAAADSLGPLGSLTCMLSSQLSPGLARLLSMIAHSACSLALFMVARKLTRGIANYISISISIFASLIFAVSPLSSELISYLGGVGIELSILFFLLSLNFYVGGHPVFGSPQRKTSVLAVVFFVIAIMAYSKAWLLAKIFAWFEILNFSLDSESRQAYKTMWQDKTSQSRKHFLITFCSIALISMLGMSIEFVRGENPIASFWGLFSHLKHMLLAVFFPINRAIWNKYSPEYVFLYIVFGFAMTLAAVGIFRNARFRVIACLSLIWIFYGALIGGESSLIANDFYGSRVLAFASVGLALGFSTFTFGLASAFQLPFKTGLIPGIILCSLFIVSNSRHSFHQSVHYKNAAKLLEKIQKSVKITSAKENSEYAVVRDLPRQVSLTPTISPFRPVVLDGLTGLLRSPIVSGGFVKDVLQNNQTGYVVARWDNTFDSLIPVLKTPKINDPVFQFDAIRLAKVLNPPLQFWKTVSLDIGEKSLKIVSNSDHEPGINFAPGYVSPIDGNIFYVDAKIDTPIEPANPNVELHWITVHNNDFEKEDRRSTVKAILNDNVYHRYLLSLRNTGWATNGSISSLTLGFPSSATVQIKEIGIIAGEGVFPQLKIAEGESPSKQKSSFAQLCFDYPTDKNLGLLRLNKNSPEAKLTYDFSGITGSASGTLISSLPDQFSFKADAGPLPEEISFKNTLSGNKGEVQISRGQFPKSGIYGVRAVAQNAQGEPLSKFSDTIWILVDQSN